MDSSKLIAVYTSVATEDAAQMMAHEAVRQKLAACVQIEPIKSVYEWQGQIHCDPEHRVSFKTTRAAYDALENLIRSLHSYDLPAIFAVPVEVASHSYQRWVIDNVRPVE